MPAKTPRTFDAAAKHLFRHLHDARLLRLNPIARPFFEAASAPESPYRARQALADLRALVLEVAERLRKEEAAAGDGARAARQFAIVKMLYVDGVPIHAVANALNISVKHCYRERAAICRRIARALDRRNKSSAVVMEPAEGFYVLLDRLIAQESDATRDALVACECLEHLAKTTSQQVAALRAAVIVSLMLRDEGYAETAYVHAARLYDEDGLTLSADRRRTVEAMVNHMAWMLAHYRGQSDRAMVAAQRGVHCFERGPIERTPQADRLQVQMRLNFCAELWARGDLAAAYELLNETGSRCDQLAPFASIRFRVEGSLWKLRTYFVLNNACSSDARIDGLLRAKERALRFGALLEALDAMVSITECHVFAKRDAEALRSARPALALAEAVQNPAERAQIAIELAVRLLSTRFWPVALQMLPAESARGNLDCYRRQLLCYALALGAFRAGDVEKAWRSAASADTDVRLATLDVRRGLLAAESAYLLGRKAQAYQAAEMALAAAEELGAAPLLHDAYAVSGRILGRPRAVAQALEIARILAA